MTLTRDSRSFERTLFAYGFADQADAETVARVFGADPEPGHLLLADDLASTLSTVARVPDVDGLVRLPGDRSNPEMDTLRALAAASGRVIVTAVIETGGGMNATLASEVNEAADYHWLQLAPAVDQVGTLSTALTVIAEHGIDLDFLHSDEVATGGHQFFLGFAAAREVFEALCTSLITVGVSATPLAGFRA